MPVELKDAIEKVARAIVDANAEIGPRDDADRDWWNRRRVILARHAEALAEQLGGRINDRWDGCRVRLCGIAATSTTGIEGALRNWIAAAHRRIEEGRV